MTARRRSGPERDSETLLMIYLARRNSRKRSRRRRPLIRLLPLLTGIALVPLISAYLAAQSPPPEPPSAFGNEFVSYVTVSPRYEQTGTVLAIASRIGCQGEGCTRIWISRDGGHSWNRKAGAGWTGGRPVIAADGQGREVLFSPGRGNLVRSDDFGDTWTAAGPNGDPTPSPTFSQDGMLAVASKPSYVIQGGSQRKVAGSGGALVDQRFMFAPTYPNGGTHAPALLVGSDKNVARPLVQQCSADLACRGAAPLVDPGDFPFPVTLHPTSAFGEDGTVFAQAGNSIHKSTDGGATFAKLSIGDPKASGIATPAMGLAPSYREAGPIRTAYVAVLQTFFEAERSRTEGGVYGTRDGGVTWSRLPASSVLDHGATALAVAPDGRLFAGYLRASTVEAARFGLVCSTDGGKTWRASCPAVGAPGGKSGGEGEEAGSSKRGSGDESAAGTRDGASADRVKQRGLAQRVVHTVRTNWWAMAAAVAAAVVLAGVLVLVVRKRFAAR